MTRNSLGTFLIIIGLASLQSGCKKAGLEEKEYVEWVESPENGLRQEKKIGSFVYDIQYNTLEYILLNESRKEPMSPAVRDKRQKEIEGMQYFNLRLSSTEAGDVLLVNAGSNQEYMQRANYFSYEAQNDIQLIEGTDTLPCELFHFTQNYGIAPYADFIMAFERSSEEIKTGRVLHDKELVITDNVLGNGIIRFMISKESINNSPTLMLK